MRLTVTMEDFKEALCRTFLLTEKRWMEVEQQARRVAAERRLDANRQRVDELLKMPPGSPMWRAAHDEIDRIWAEHDALLEIAYPRVNSPTPPPEEP